LISLIAACTRLSKPEACCCSACWNQLDMSDFLVLAPPGGYLNSPSEGDAVAGAGCCSRGPMAASISRQALLTEAGVAGRECDWDEGDLNDSFGEELL